MHRNFKSAAIALALSQVFPALAAQDEAAIIVTATRQQQRANELLSDITVLTREEIEQAGPATLPELLSRQPGLHVVDNGGPGKTASVFMRGASASHTLLLVDGVPLGSATSGTPSLHNLPLSQIDHIEILRGPASSLYGSDAIGGVIQIFTRRGEGPARLNAYVGGGTYATREAQAGVAGGSGDWSYSFMASQFATDGFNVAADPVRYKIVNYSLPNPDADGYRNTSYTGRLAFKLADGHEVGASMLEAASRNHYDGGGANVNAYSNDLTRVQSVYLRDRFSDAWTSTLRWGASEDHSESFAPRRSLFATRQTQLTWQNDVRLPVGSLMLALEDNEQAVDSTTKYTVTSRRVNSVIAGYQGNLGAHSWQASLRRDDNSQFGGRTTSSLGYGYRFTAEWQARIATGTAFKAPSFNQLYYPGYGNANLKPEEARNREVAVSWDRGGHHAALTMFNNQITNLIAGSPITNINAASIRGMSLAYGLSKGPWQTDAALDLMRPVDASTGYRLQRRPAQMGKLGLGYAPGIWKVGGEIAAIGRRFDSTNETRAMGGYGVANLFAARELAKNWTLEGRINNLFDRVYENAWSYAVPGRSLFVGLRYAPN